MASRVELLKEFQAWKSQEVTKELLAAIKETVAMIQDAWANGAYTSEQAAGTAQANASALGQVKALSNIADVIESGEFIKGVK